MSRGVDHHRAALAKPGWGVDAGGQVQQPLTPTFFPSSFGMLVDRFGVAWMVLVPIPPSGGATRMASGVAVL
jgi:hypothetical protein